MPSDQICQLQQVRDYIGDHLHLALSIPAICRQFNTNKTSLQQRFRKYCGLSLHAFMLQRRMEKAATLLRQSDEPVKFVAYQCGYKKVRSFNKAFKLHWKMSPGIYRKIVPRSKVT